MSSTNDLAELGLFLFFIFLFFFRITVLFECSLLSPLISFLFLWFSAAKFTAWCNFFKFFKGDI
jgi:hypothetical protein